MRHSAPLLLVVSGVLGCSGSDDSATVPPILIETGVDQSTWTDLSVEPTGMRVSVGARFRLKVRATSPMGERVEPDVEWSVEPEDAGRVDAGEFVAMAPGTAMIVASLDGVEVSAAVDIEESAALQMVVRGPEGPVEGARILVNGEESGVSDPDGVSEIHDLPSGPLDVAVHHPDVVPLTVLGVTGRNLDVEVRGRDEPDEPVVEGTIDFSELDPGPGELGIGWVVPTVAEPWWTSFGELMGANRSISVFGVGVDLPLAIAVSEHDEAWAVRATGTESVRAFATALPLEEALAAASGSSSPIDLIAERLGDARTASAATAGTDSVILRPGGSLASRSEVPLGRLPDGASSPAVIVLGLDETGRVLGLGAGLDRVTVHAVSTPSHYLALFEDGGLGSGGGVSVAYGTELADFLELPSAPSISTTESVVHRRATAGDVVLATIRDGRDRQRDLLFPSEMEVLPIGSIPSGIDFETTTWELRSVAYDRQTFDGILAAETGMAGLAVDVAGVSYLRARATGSR